MFSAVGFDLGDTLLDYAGLPLSWQREYPRALAAAAESCGATPAAGALARAGDVLARYNTRLVPRAREITDAELFGDVFGVLGIGDFPDSAAFDAAVDVFFSVFRGRAVAAHDGASTIKTLEDSGIRGGVLTDVAYAMPRRLVLEDLAVAGLTRLGALTLTSAQVGWRKPRPEGFRCLADLLGVSVDGMLYVGNEKKDVTGAVGAGASAALLWASDESVPQWGQCYTLGGLGELAALVV